MDWKDIQEQVRRYVWEYYGPECDHFIPGCPVCDAWRSYQVLFEDGDLRDLNPDLK